MLNPSLQTSSNSNTIRSYMVVVFGIGLYFVATTFLGGFENLDTTGRANTSTQVGALIFCATLVMVGLFFVNRKKS